MNFFKYLTAKFGMMDDLENHSMISIVLGTFVHMAAFLCWLPATINQEGLPLIMLIPLVGAIITISLIFVDEFIEILSDVLTRGRGKVVGYFKNKMIPEDMRTGRYDYPRAIPFAAFSITYATIAGIVGLVISLPMLAVILALIVAAFFAVRKKIDQYYEGRG